MRPAAIRRFTPATLLAAAILAVPTAATAVPPTVNPPLEDFVFEVPEGQGCAEFPLGIEATGSQSPIRTFYDRSGEVSRVLIAGQGYALTFSNPENDKELVLKPTGFSRTTVTREDGRQDVVDRGAFAIILFPTDTPAGPAATLYQGRAVYTLSADGSNMLESLTASGRTTDICAALS